MTQAEGPWSSSFFLSFDLPKKPLLFFFSSLTCGVAANVPAGSGGGCCLWGVVGLLEVPLPASECAGDELLDPPGPTAPGIGGGSGRGSSKDGSLLVKDGLFATGEGPVRATGCAGSDCPQEETRRSAFESLLVEARASCAETGLRPRASVPALLPFS